MSFFRRYQYKQREVNYRGISFLIARGDAGAGIELAMLKKDRTQIEFPMPFAHGDRHYYTMSYVERAAKQAIRDKNYKILHGEKWGLPSQPQKTRYTR
jgi:hypothetical protein